MAVLAVVDDVEAKVELAPDDDVDGGLEDLVELLCAHLPDGGSGVGFQQFRGAGQGSHVGGTDLLGHGDSLAVGLVQARSGAESYGRVSEG